MPFSFSLSVLCWEDGRNGHEVERKGGLVAPAVPNENCRIKRLCWLPGYHEGEEEKDGGVDLNMKDNEVLCI